VRCGKSSKAGQVPSWLSPAFKYRDASERRCGSFVWLMHGAQGFSDQFLGPARISTRGSFPVSAYQLAARKDHTLQGSDVSYSKFERNSLGASLGKRTKQLA
jgi:hypothetical protein